MSRFVSQGCLRKHRFDTKDAAEAARRVMPKRPGHSMRTKWCPLCWGHHIMSRTPRIGRRKI
jgi:hypothetical protein